MVKKVIQEHIYWLIEVCIKENFKIIILMIKDNIYGRTEKFIMLNEKIIKCMVKV